MPLLHNTITRQNEIDALLEALSESNCCSVVGLSNTGKSTLLRSLHSSEVQAKYTALTGRRVAIVYIDCNAMLELSGQGFYELTLRNVLESIPDLGETLAARLNENYRQIVDPDTQFLVPLNFNNAMTAVISEDHRDLVLLFDEFDEAFDTLDGRVFLNLRALKDKYPGNLTYVTATVRMLGSKRSDEQTAEFVELSAQNIFILKPLTRDESDELAQALVLQALIERDLTEAELAFLWEQTGGHPRMLRAAVSHLIEIHTNTPDAHDEDILETIQEVLTHDITLRTECTRIWGQLGPGERKAMSDIATGMPGEVSARLLHDLVAWGLIYYYEDEPFIFSELMADFARRQAIIQRKLPEGISVNSDSGDVWVDGVPTAPLTEMEFRLISLLGERSGKLTDKYQIVERVWGVEYIDDVDDARIEKLISRLRAKVEPDPSTPRYITTIRGRGYKLINPE